MNRVRAPLLTLPVIVLYACSAQTASFVDLDGNVVRPLDAGTAVVIFTRTDCPISNKYAPELNRLHTEFSPAGISFWLAYVNPDANPVDIAKHRVEYGYRLRAVIDGRQELVMLAGVKTTPEAAVFHNGKLVYRGRIDDRFAALGKFRPAPQQRDLHLVLTELAQNRPVRFRSTTAVGCAIETTSAAGRSPTWADVAPVIHANCTPCHRAGEAAPFPLLTLDDIRAHAKQLVAVTKARVMPPWKAAPGRGDFIGARSLSNDQIRLIEQWVDSGAPDAPQPNHVTPPRFPDDGQLGTPDLVVTLERPYVLPAEGPDVFRNFILKLPIDKVRYARAVEIRPGNKRFVHHANLLIDRDRSSRTKDGRDGAPGFPGMDTRIETRTFDPESHFLFWKPGTPPREEPDGMALQLDPGTDLILNMHLQPGGRPEPIQPSVAIYFTDNAPGKRPILIQLENDGSVDIPAGSTSFTVSDRLTLPAAVDVLAIYPHAHYLGHDVQAKATLPDGSEKWLIHIPDWDINWQAVYRYREPVHLPKGSTVSFRITYDNSEGNVRNPNRPPKRVHGGDRAEDEMAHLWLQLLPATSSGPDARVAIRKAVLQHRLDKYPSDFYAEFSLAALAQTEGKLDDAVARYRRALKAKPDDASVHNALGSALLEAGQDTAAIAAFQTAIRVNPEFADPHYNVARIMLTRGETASAARHLREALRIDPQDAQSMSDLGAALFLLNQPADGLPLLQNAVGLQPDNYNARFNLGQALAVLGRSKDAREQFTQALRIRPADPDATAALSQLPAR